MKISKKITINNITACVIIVMISLTLIFISRESIKTYADFHNKEFLPLDKLRKIQLIYREIEFRIIGTWADVIAPIGSAAHLTNSLNEIDKLLKEIDELVPKDENRAERDKIAKGHKLFKEELSEELLERYQDEDLEDMPEFYNEWLDAKALIFRSIDKYVADKTNEVHRIYSERSRMLNMLSFAAGAASIVIVIFFIFMSASVVKSIRSPLNKAINLLNELAAGHGDLTMSLFKKKVNCSEIRKCGFEECRCFGEETNSCMIEVGSYAEEFGEKITCPTIKSGKLDNCDQCAVMKILIKDEIDELSFAVDLFVRKIKQIVTKIRDVSLTLSSSTEELSAQAALFTDNAQTQAASAEEINSAVEQVSDGHEHARNTMILFNQLVDHIMSKLEKSMETAAETSGKMNNAMRSRKILDHILKTVQERNEQINDRMNEARKVADDTRDIIRSVTDISEQINLLSLNAAIEAARAGELGRGFAVVADEIGKLSDQTQENVNIITDRIENTTRVINLANDEIFKVLDNIKTVVKEIRNFGLIVEELNKMLETENNIKKGIQGEAKTMKDSSEIIQKSMEEHNRAIHEISKSMNSINHVIQENVSGAEEIKSSTEETAKMADILRHHVSRFKIE